jgi:hypothetical protein
MTKSLHFQQIHYALFPSAQTTQEVSCKNSKTGGSKKTWILTGGKLDIAQILPIPYDRSARPKEDRR